MPAIQMVHSGNQSIIINDELEEEESGNDTTIITDTENENDSEHETESESRIIQYAPQFSHSKKCKLKINKHLLLLLLM